MDFSNEVYEGKNACCGVGQWGCQQFVFSSFFSFFLVVVVVVVGVAALRLGD
jgi:hypothetical protein